METYQATVTSIWGDAGISYEVATFWIGAKKLYVNKRVKKGLFKPNQRVTVKFREAKDGDHILEFAGGITNGDFRVRSAGE